MFRVLFIFLVFVSALNASYIKDVEILTTSNKKLTIEEAKNSNDFKRTKLPLIRHDKDYYFLKVTFNKEDFKNKNMIVELDTSFNYTEVEKHLPYSTVYKNRVLEYNEDKFHKTIYIKIFNEEGYINLDVSVHDAEKYIFNQILLNKLYGLAYGILLAAVLYYFALYLFNREKSYIYYSLTQLSMLAILVFVSSKEMFGDRHIIDFIFFFFFLFSNMFTKSFLNTKVNAPKINIALNLTIAIYVCDLIIGLITGFYFFEDNIPLSSLLVVYLIAAIIVYKKGYKPAFFYLIGWSLMIFSFLFIEIQFYFTQTALLIKPVYLMHIVTPMESLVLAFALAYKMKVLEEEKLEQQQFVTHQSKLASMGEMIGNIAHQWRQPLTHLSYILMNLKTAFEKDRLTSEYFDKKSKEANEQLEFMSHTIDDFRHFFKTSKQKEEFGLNAVVDEVINLLSASFDTNKIEVSFTKKDDIQITSSRGELLQVLFNILNNAKDEFIRNSIENPKVNIEILKQNDSATILISDNAGGIKSELISKIFEPYFTTKDKGLGLGLYMSKMIMDKSIGGKLEVKNIENGAQFLIKV